MSSHHQSQECFGGVGGSFMQYLSSRSSRRKGTDHSVELALIECAQESDSDGGNKKRQYRGMVARIREGLMEATDPQGYAQRKLRVMIEEEKELTKDEYYFQFQSFCESPTLRMNSQHEDLKEEDRSPNLSTSYLHLGSFDFENKGLLAVIVEDNAADAETEILKGDEMSPSKLLRKNPQLSIKIEQEASEVVEASSINQQVAGVRQSVGSCDKSSTVQKAFFGIDPTIQISGHANSINENLTRNLKGDSQEKLVAKMNHRKSSEDHTQIPLPNFNFNQKTCIQVPQLRISQQNLLPISHRNKSQPSVVSPQVAGGNRSQFENFSPRSSNVSSFYMDHIEDMLPEKMLITHKKLMRNYLQINPLSVLATNSATQPANMGFSGCGISPTTSPYTPIRYGYGPYQRSQGTTVSSLTRRMPFRWRKDDKQKYQEPPLHVRISQLKDSLTKFKDTKAQRKEIVKKNIAQSMKFLRKLGSKLRKQYSKRKFNAGKSEDRQIPACQVSANPLNSPGKSINYESPQRISPRQSIMQSQQIKNGLQPSVTQGFQIKVHNVSPQVDSLSAPKILMLSQLQQEAPPPFLMPNQPAFAPMFNFFQGRVDLPQTAKNAPDDHLPLFNPMMPLFSFERQGSFNIIDRPNSNDFAMKHDAGALKREISSDFGINTRSNNQSCDFGGNNRQGSFADVQSSSSQIEETKRASHIRQNSGMSGNVCDEPSRQFSFAPKDMMSAFQQLQQMQSPIPGMRNDVREALDDVEENLIEAIQEYREDTFIKDFHHYKDYYVDAQQQNAELLQLQVTPQKVDLAQHSSSGSNRSALDFGDILQRPRDYYVSFKDQRNFENSSSEIWKHHMDKVLLDDFSSSGKEVEKTNPTPRVPTIFEKIIEEDEQEWNEMERQVFELALIDQSQPDPHPVGSLPKASKKKQNSQQKYRKICENIRDLATSLDYRPNGKGNFYSSTRDLMDGPDSSRGSRRDYHHQQQHASKVSSLERGQIRLTTSGSRSRSGGSLNKLSIESPKNTLKAKERLERSQLYHATLMKDKQALKKIHQNLKRLYEDLTHPTQTVNDSPGLETLLHRFSTSNNNINQRQPSYATSIYFSEMASSLSPPCDSLQESPIHPQFHQVVVQTTLQPQQMMHKAKGHRPQQPKQRQVPHINLNLLQCVRSNSTQSKVDINLGSQ